MAELVPFAPRRRDVPGHLRDLAGELARALEPHPAVAVAYLFGSVARGEARPGSDLDVGIVFTRRGETARDHLALIGELAARIEGLGGLRDVDLVVLESQGPIFCHRVISEGVLVYERDPERRVDFESDTIVRALDFRPTYELAARGQVRGLRRWLRERYDLR
ncbi:MAG: nucleotidyltransferase domain-containing protein [Deltaproteobacteria bacterium]|nr:nucleotidyltransferase domain-containing protein [Deltaproteobacteria bacterium]